MLWIAATPPDWRSRGKNFKALKRSGNCHTSSNDNRPAKCREYPYHKQGLPGAQTIISFDRRRRAAHNHMGVMGCAHHSASDANSCLIGLGLQCSVNSLRKHLFCFAPTILSMCLPVIVFKRCKSRNFHTRPCGNSSSAERTVRASAERACLPYPTLPYPTLPYPSLLQCKAAGTAARFGSVSDPEKREI